MAQTTETGNLAFIDKFDGKYAFLSNFYECPVTHRGITYKNSEAAFQAQKTVDVHEQLKFSTVNASTAKKMGRSIPLRQDWETVKVAIMEEIVMQKFLQNPNLEKRLLDTDNAQLVEGNWWKDTFWGVCNGVGKNMLGKILMEVRSYIVSLRCAEAIQPCVPTNVESLSHEEV